MVFARCLFLLFFPWLFPLFLLDPILEEKVNLNANLNEKSEKKSRSVQILPDYLTQTTQIQVGGERVGGGEVLLVWTAKLQSIQE